MEFEVGDKVKFYEHEDYFCIPSYGTIIKLTPKFADVESIIWEQSLVTRVRKTKLIWTH